MQGLEDDDGDNTYGAANGFNDDDDENTNDLTIVLVMVMEVKTQWEHGSAEEQAYGDDDAHDNDDCRHLLPPLHHLHHHDREISGDCTADGLMTGTVTVKACFLAMVFVAVKYVVLGVQMVKSRDVAYWLW